MQRAVLLGSALALSFGFAAVAQPAAQTPPAAPKPSAAPPTSTPPAAPPAAEPAAPPAAATPGPSASAAPLKEGMAVKDASGAPVGTIAQLGKTSDGQAAAMLDIDGKKVGVLASSLTVSGAEAVSAATKAQLLAAAAATTQRPG